MATLVLTAFGNLLGGPIGGAIGALIGRQVDRSWLAPGGMRDGPRLKELDVQTSSYGTEIPAVFGAMRVAGTVIWATDIVERSAQQSGGKGRASTNIYSYSVSLAVALSSRPVERIGRIWADGNLLRGAQGDLKYETELRFHLGNGDQLPDPLLASAEQAGQCPAYRGLAYAVFENLQLAPFGQRIPQLSFEIFERDGPVIVADIAGSVGRFIGTSDAMVTGYALAGANGRVALQPLVETLPVLVRSNGDKLELLDSLNEQASISVQPLRSNGTSDLEKPQKQLLPVNDIPRTMILRYYDPARDYQLGVQRSENACGGQRELQQDLPAALTSNVARSLAELRSLDEQCGRNRWQGYVAVGPVDIRPGEWIEPEPGIKYRIENIEKHQGFMRIEARQALDIMPEDIAAIPGRNVSSPDALSGETRLILADLPAIGSDPGRPLFAIFAAGTEPGWRRAALSLRQGDNLLELGGSAAPASMGMAETVLGWASPHLIDRGNGVVVQMLHEQMVLPAGGGALSGDIGPLCLLGGEYLRYGSAIPLGNGRYRLHELLRGLFGTEAACDQHASGDAFLLIEARAASEITAINPAPGQGIEVEGLGSGDVEPATATIIASNRSVTPLPPVHARVARLAENGLRLSWMWRSRVDLGWQDGVDQPCPDDPLSFSIDIVVDGTFVDRRTTAVPKLEITQADLTAWMPAGGIVLFRISHVGRYARSSDLNIEYALAACTLTRRLSVPEASPRHALPYLFVGQAMKEITHNEALVLLDALIHPTAESVLSTPPSLSPSDHGKCWLIDQDATGDWAGQEGKLACWTSSGWRFLSLPAGSRVRDHASGSDVRVGVGGIIFSPEIAPPVGGAIVDVEAREIIAQLLEHLCGIGVLRTGV